MTTDPVCGMELEEADAAGEAEFLGTRYYFCSDTCREEFLRHPSQYVGEGDQPIVSP
jgi:YHS domain-containing protein